MLIDLFLSVFSECSKIFTGQNGSILSPDYPGEYPDNLACSWAIQVSTERRIKLYFEDFQLEKAVSCFDHLVIKDGVNGPSLGTYKQRSFDVHLHFSIYSSLWLIGTNLFIPLRVRSKSQIYCSLVSGAHVYLFNSHILSFVRKPLNDDSVLNVSRDTLL